VTVERPFNARKKFQFVILCVRAMVRIQRLRFTPEALSLATTRIDPYRLKALRKARIICSKIYLVYLLAIEYVQAKICSFRVNL